MSADPLEGWDAERGRITDRLELPALRTSLVIDIPTNGTTMTEFTTGSDVYVVSTEAAEELQDRIDHPEGLRKLEMVEIERDDALDDLCDLQREHNDLQREYSDLEDGIRDAFNGAIDGIWALLDATYPHLPQRTPLDNLKNDIYRTVAKHRDSLD